MNNFEQSLPEQYRPLSPWAYIGYSILFSVPLIGFICIIIFALNDSNINRRNFARSYFCVLVIIMVLIIILFVTGVAAAFFTGFTDAMNGR